MITFKKLYIVLGISGCKKDFLTGWLGTLPTFVDTRWHLSLPTGGSFSDAFYIKEIDAEPDWTFVEILKKNQLELSADSDLNLAISCHGLHLLNNLKGLTEHEYEIINIDVSDDSMSIVFWEQLAKNFLRYNNNIDSLRSENYLNKFIIRYVSEYKDSLSLSDEQQIEIIQNLYPKYDMTNFEWINDVKNRLLWCRLQDQIPMKHLNYDELFVPGGSKVICDALELSIPAINHRYWDAMLPFSTTPDEVEFLGKVWKKSDFIK